MSTVTTVLYVLIAVVVGAPAAYAVLRVWSRPMRNGTVAQGWAQRD